MSKEIKLMAREILDFITFNCTPETADRLLAELEKLGITASFATPDEAEVLYLLKTAYILNLSYSHIAQFYT